jgi:hypothetical protein
MDERDLWQEAVRAVETQGDKLDELRGRAAAVLTSGAVVAGFLGAQSFDKQNPSKLAHLGAVSFVLLVVAVAIALVPLFRFRFERHPWELINAYRGARDDEPTSPEYDLTYHLGDDYNMNRARIEVITWSVFAAVVLLIIESASFFFDLT